MANLHAAKSVLIDELTSAAALYGSLKIHRRVSNRLIQYTFLETLIKSPQGTSAEFIIDKIS